MTTTLAIEVIYALPTQVFRIALSLPSGVNVTDALLLATPALYAQCENMDFDETRIAIFGRLIGLKSRLHDGDRIELLRPLLADPKQARRARAQEKTKGAPKRA